MTITTGARVRITYCGQTREAWVLLASPNGRSLMLSFEGILYSGDHGAFFGSIPLLKDDDGVYRDLMHQTHEAVLELLEPLEPGQVH